MNKSGIEWCDHTWNPITGCKHGIFIGSPVSKDLCNYYLSYLYHYCTNELYEMKTRRGKTTRKRLIYHIMIQMDDIILFGSNKKDLHKAKEISQICQSTVFAGTDIDISSGKEHFTSFLPFDGCIRSCAASSVK